MGRMRKYDEQLLVVVNPWPPSGPKHKHFVNNVSTWFEIMLREDNPRVSLKVEAIYQQKTHPNIIVELPAEANIEHLLGAHHWDVFTKEPYNRHDGQISYVYEYNYDTFHHPSRINWYVGMPSYRTIDPAFPIHSPYPSPSPAPAPRLLYATNLPKHLRIDKNAAPVHDPCLPEIDDVKVGCLVIEKCVVVRKLARQKDPTVDTPLQGPKEESMRVLKSSAPEPGPERDSVLGKEANTRVKVESTYDDYTPPPELVLSYEGYLDNAGEQKPDTSTLIKREDDYQPSRELQSAIAEFQARHGVEVKREEKPKKGRDLWEADKSDEPAKRIKREHS